ncbi:MAG: single-stranded-DNA-specific exonuclease RecJ [Candidatus Uhrbacteria bacterium]
MDKTWVIADLVPEDARREFADVHPVVLQLLWNRGVRLREQMGVFLSPDWNRDVHSPSLFRNMPEAVARVFKAMENGEVITVHGDYDADGVCGSAVLISTLREICRAFGFDETKTTSFIPDREKDGYGVSPKTVDHLHEHDKTGLIITVDCGISNKPAIDRAKELGIDTIVCDHHAMPAELPTAAILIHPQVPGETYPNKSLCGTGVAFKLACGLIEEARRREADGRTDGAPKFPGTLVPLGETVATSTPNGTEVPGNSIPVGHEKWLLDLVAIATVTDVMPLTGENRTLETFGLVVLNKTRRPGLRALVDVAGGKFGLLDTFSIGFQIGPRINAAGRMNHASAALSVLLEEDEMKAVVLAGELNDANIARQKASEAMYQEALAQVGEIGDRKLIIAVGNGWPAGLVGLVAGKLVNLYGRPTYVVGKNEEGKYVGSGRSVEGFDVTECLKSAANHLDKFGGHPQACGFSVTGPKKFMEAVVAMNAYAETTLAGRDLAPTLKIDAAVDVGDANWALLDELNKFSPCGEGNPKPVFVADDLTVSQIATMGADGKHLRLTALSKNGKLAKMVAFGFGEWAAKLKVGDAFRAAFEIGMNEWNGNKELQMRIVDLKVAE